MATTETSVLANLNELFAIEATRIGEEKAARELELREAENRRRAEREARTRRLADEAERVERERRAAEQRAAACAAADERERRAHDARLETERALAIERARAETLARAREQELEHARLAAALGDAKRDRMGRRLLVFSGIVALLLVVGGGFFVVEHRAAIERLEASRGVVERQIAAIARARESSSFRPRDTPTEAPNAVSAGSHASPDSAPSVSTRTPRGPRSPDRHVSSGAASTRRPPTTVPAAGDCRGPLGSLCRSRDRAAFTAQ